MGICCAVPTCAQGSAGPTPEGKEKSAGFLLLVITLLLSRRCLWVPAAGGTPSQITPTNSKINTETRAHGNTQHKHEQRDAGARKQKPKNKNRDARTNIQIQQRIQTRTNTYEQTPQIQLHVHIHFLKNEFPRRPLIQTAGERSGHKREGFFFARALFVQIQQGRNYETRRCSGGPRGAECSQWAHFRGVPEKGKIPLPSDAELCGKATASLASGTVREHAAVWVGSGRLRENEVPRHWQGTCPILITVLSQNMSLNVFRSLRCFLDSSTCPHTSTWARKNAHHASSLIFLASASFALRTSTCPERLKFVGCRRTHFNLAKLFFRRR